jgi:hypothetical protein
MISVTLWDFAISLPEETGQDESGLFSNENHRGLLPSLLFSSSSFFSCSLFSIFSDGKPNPCVSRGGNEENVEMMALRLLRK